jgi:hypothetical protein
MNPVRLLLLFPLLFSTIAHAAAADHSTLYVQVIRGTDQDKPAGSNYRQVGKKLGSKLSPVFRWKYYWETERRKVHVDPTKVTKVLLARQRTLEIEHLKSGDTEIRLTRRSGLVTKARQPLNGRMVILGGEDSSKESFFVVVRPDEPVALE